jgi:hypothetical protein
VRRRGGGGTDLLGRGGCKWPLRTLARQPAHQSARDLAQHDVHVVLLPHEHEAVRELGLRLGGAVRAWRWERGEAVGDRRVWAGSLRACAEPPTASDALWVGRAAARVGPETGCPRSSPDVRRHE